jgi:S-DNA-T family DNA segregation ATPase FtsK/SpoIIIE
MDDLLREAIADAKAVRETALENAKIALEEAFTPRLQSMLSKKIQAEMEDSEEGEEVEEMEAPEEEEMDAEEMRDAEEMEMDAEEMRDAEEMEDAEEEEMDEAEDAEEMEDSEEGEEMREEEDAEEEDSVEEAEDAEEEDELDLESVLAELEKDLDDEDDIEEVEDKDEEEKVDEAEDTEEEETMDENDVSSDIGKGDNKVAPAANDSSKVGQGPESEGSDKKAGDELGDHETVDDLVEVEDKDEEDLDLDEVLRALTEEEAEEQDAEENEKLKAEIQEHRKVIHFMRSKLNEVNLLNAKLLFSNKLFRAFGLNNNQKLKVVETFDRTKNLREVKLVYATLAESFKKPTSKLVESKGSSSKPVRSTKPAKQEVLSEGQELRNRFKKLANIL